jgi:hypothetical protein
MSTQEGPANPAGLARGAGARAFLEGTGCREWLVRAGVPSMRKKRYGERAIAAVSASKWADRFTVQTSASDGRLALLEGASGGEA